MANIHEAQASSDKPERPSTTLPGIVQKVIAPIVPGDPEKAQVAVEGADHLYRELRIENKLVDEDGEKVKLKPGAVVDVTIEAEADQTTGKGV
ncbi:MAG: hypothetical protein WCC04_15830 [Terriglobales bacterium]